WLSTAGWVGVDLFFVLSGYLIGNQVFACWAQGQAISLPACYARRALRTWPVCWLVLAAFFVFPTAMGGKTPPPLWAFLSFTQNYQLQPGTAFSHAWSLCIEEQFYAVFPLIVLAAWAVRRVLKRRYADQAHQVRRIGLGLAWGLMALLLTVGITARTLLWGHYGLEAGDAVRGYYPHIYYATLCRFDEFLPGLVVALLKNFYPVQWQRVHRSGLGFFSVGVLACAAMLYGVLQHYYVDGYGYGFWMTALGYSLVAWAFAMLVASALAPRSPWHWLRVPGAHHLALWSYSIYLIHKPLAFYIHGRAGMGSLGPGLELAAVALGSVALGALLYYAVELPFMRVRDRWFPALVSQAA
ncbi:MAG: acyltransferase, partial [Burkholderiales bacterium PBB4]